MLHDLSTIAREGFYLSRVRQCDITNNNLDNSSQESMGLRGGPKFRESKSDPLPCCQMTNDSYTSEKNKAKNKHPFAS